VSVGRWLVPVVLVLPLAVGPSTASAQTTVGPVTCTTSGCSVVSNSFPRYYAFCGSGEDAFYGELTGCRLRVAGSTISCGVGRRASSSGDVYAYKGCVSGPVPYYLLLAGCQEQTSADSRSSYCGTAYGNGCGKGERTDSSGRESHWGYCGSLAGGVGCGKGYNYPGGPVHNCTVGTLFGFCSHDLDEPPAPTPEQPYPYAFTGCYTSFYPLNPEIWCKEGYEPDADGNAVRVDYCTVVVAQITCRYDRLTGDFGCDPGVTGRRDRPRPPLS
jgi:hypothetical protein